MVSVMLYPLFYVCSVNVTVCIVCCLFDSVCELFDETICNFFGGVVVIMLLNVMGVFSVSGCSLLDKACMVF